MDARECADILRAAIRHRRRMHEKEIEFIGKTGEVETRGTINPEADIFYRAMKFALSCVEEKISK